MGVHGLWPLLHPVARPVALETMGGKKLAIDSSIWLYQFQIAMRDKEGRALDNAHILGFLRRICKLLFYGIKPVFVFDGGAPLIKKIAISNRKNRKQGAKESAARTAEKLLAAQLRAAAVAQAQKQALERDTGDIIDETNANYLDEEYGIAPRGAPERRKRREPDPDPPDPDGSSSPAAAGRQPSSGDTPPVTKKKKYVHRDQYALPNIDEPLAKRAQPADPRLATEAELRSFIDDMRPEDFDMDSEPFANLPTEVKYEIIGDLRIKSRQSNYRRVEAMKAAPTPLDFSKAQILGVSHRNRLTQKLLTVTDSLSRIQPSLPTRIAGERNKEYVLIKNDTAQGAGYILGVRDDGKSASSPVKIETTTSEESDQDDKTTTDEEFEQVKIPESATRRSPTPDRQYRREMAIKAIQQRYSPVKGRRAAEQDEEDLQEEEAFRARNANQSALFSKTTLDQPVYIDSSSTNPGIPDDVFAQVQAAIESADEEDDMQRAIAESVSRPAGQQGRASAGNNSDDESDVDFDEVETQDAAPLFEISVPRSATTAPPSSSAARKTGSSLPSSREAAGRSGEPIMLTSDEERADASPSRSATLARRENPSPAAMNGSRPKKLDRTARPDLTQEQAKRDTSPQAEAESHGVIMRDFAQYPPSPPMLSPQAPSSPAPLRSVTPEPNVAEASSAPSQAERPSLMTRTLSTQSNADSTLKSRSPSLEPVFNIPDASEVLHWHGSAADKAAVSNGPIHVLHEGPSSTLDEPAEAEDEGAQADQATGLDKGDLQAEVSEGDVLALASIPTIDAGKVPTPPTTDASGALDSQMHDTADDDDDGQSSRKEGSPEIFYEWSPSPEPVARKRPMDATLLSPDDPNYIPPDIVFPDPEEDLTDEYDREHVESLTSEQREYAKFLSELKNKNLDEMEVEVQSELKILSEQNKRDRKLADDITQQMAKDIQTMLRVLGLPYVIAPMEAEAQCAELLARNLVDGVITDDNDVFLFGASRVYKNMFNQNKYVECYLSSDIDRELALDRKKLIRLAHFLGSDYCDGLPGVGPVLGMELMAEFPGENGLVEFRNWWLKVQRGRDTSEDHPTAFRRKFKKSKRELFIDESWPNPEVAKAYLNPQVDESDEPFAWGIPDLDAMRDFLRDSLGWGPAKVDELLLPIIKRMTGRATGNAINQSTISNFFDVSGGTGRFAPMSNKGYQSKRLQNVVKAWRQSQQRLQQKQEEEEEDGGAVARGSDEEDGSDGEERGTAASGRKRTASGRGRERGRGTGRGKGRGKGASSTPVSSGRPSTSRRSSGQKSSSSSSRRSSSAMERRHSSSRSQSSRQQQREGVESSADDDEYVNDDADGDYDSDANFHDELEARLEKMGVKRKREAPLGSNRVIKPNRRSKKEAARSKAKKSLTTTTTNDRTKSVSATASASSSASVLASSSASSSSPAAASHLRTAAAPSNT